MILDHSNTHIVIIVLSKKQKKQVKKIPMF